MQDITKRAIAAFDEVCKAERHAEFANAVLNTLVPQIPPEELGEYIDRTDVINDEFNRWDKVAANVAACGPPHRGSR